MTQAFNLALLANNVNSSGQLNADSGIYNTVNIANGGTNLSATPTDGQLLIGDGAGYTLATITAGSGISLTNGPGSISLSAPAAGGTRGQIFTSTGTFTVPSGVTSVKVTVVGGGGGGGSATSSNRSGTGGGGGGVAIKYITGLTSGATISVTIGGGGGAASAGGTSSFGAYCSATGGGGGTSNIAIGASGSGAGGVGSSGDFNLNGGYGGVAYGYASGAYYAGGYGGGAGNRTMPVNSGQSVEASNTAATFLCSQGYFGGYGAYSTGSATALAPPATTGYGNGGAGGNRPTTTGASGTAGVVVVEW